MSATAFEEHLAGEVTTLCHCWRLERRDGTVMGFTDHDRELTVAGTLYAPRTGFTASEARASLGLGTDSVDVEGALSSAEIGEQDVVEGLLDGATVETLVVNWRDPAQYRLVRSATISEIKRSDNAFLATLESFGTAFDQTRGRLIRRECDAELGDARCGLDLGAAEFAGSGEVIASEAGGALRVSGLDGFEPGWFAGGRLTWMGGNRLGSGDRVVLDASAETGRLLTLWPRNGAAVQAGDPFVLVAGCDKSFATCKGKFGNELNFRGFPHLPGNDEAYGYVNEDDVFDGRPVVP